VSRRCRAPRRDERREESSLKRIVIGALGLLLLSPGAVSFYIGAEGAYLGLAATSWPNAEATVTRSEAHRRRSAGRRGRGGVRHWLELQYAFTVADVRHASARYQFLDNAFFDRDDIADVVAQYPAGSQARAYYDPANPSRAVLRPGVRWFAFVACMAIACIFAVPGGALLISSLRQEDG
jgi:hypothetical protein